jgi:hypothetical protein
MTVGGIIRGMVAREATMRLRRVSLRLTHQAIGEPIRRLRAMVQAASCREILTVVNSSGVKARDNCSFRCCVSAWVFAGAGEHCWQPP